MVVWFTYSSVPKLTACYLYHNSQQLQKKFGLVWFAYGCTKIRLPVIYITVQLVTKKGIMFVVRRG